MLTGSSDDTLRRFFRVLDPKIFEDRFEAWVSYVFAAVGTTGEVIAIDGKTSRGSSDGEKKQFMLLALL